MNRWRRFEVLLPLSLNDGRPVPRKLLGEAIREIAAQFDAASYETQTIEGHWRHQGVWYQDDLSRIFVDVPDTVKNRKWMKQFKARWKKRLDQLEIWLISYRIEVE
jgi:hypothetical protein